MDTNICVLVGNLTRDAEVDYLPSGTACGKFSIAVSYRKGEKNETSYFDCKGFGKMCESLKPYLVKGKKVSVTGELRQERWEKDGRTQSKIVVLAGNIQLLGGAEKRQEQSQPAYSQEQYAGNDDGFPEDVPF